MSMTMTPCGHWWFGGFFLDAIFSQRGLAGGNVRFSGLKQKLVGGWTNPLGKHSSNLIISPRFGVNKNIWVATTQKSLSSRNAKANLWIVQAHFQLFNDLGAWSWGWCSLQIPTVDRRKDLSSKKVQGWTWHTMNPSQIKIRPWGAHLASTKWLQVNHSWFMMSICHDHSSSKNQMHH